MGKKRVKPGENPLEEVTKAAVKTLATTKPKKGGGAKPNKPNALAALPKVESILADPVVKAAAAKSEAALELSVGATRSELVKKVNALHDLIRKDLEESCRTLNVEVADWRGQAALASAQRVQLEEHCRTKKNQARQCDEETQVAAVTDAERRTKLRDLLCEVTPSGCCHFLAVSVRFHGTTHYCSKPQTPDFESAVEDVKAKLAVQSEQCEVQIKENEALAEKLAAYSLQWEQQEVHRAAATSARQTQLRLQQEQCDAQNRIQSRAVTAVPLMQFNSSIWQGSQSYFAGMQVARRDELRANLKAQREKTQSLAAQAALYKDKVGSYSDTVATNAGLWPDLDKRCEDMRASAKTMEVLWLACSDAPM
eukprot:11089-Heterococcus_DN1.PRE.1